MLCLLLVVVLVVSAGLVGTHNTMGCIMSVWCGIVFVWGEVFAPGLNYLLEEENLLWLSSFMAPRLLLLS